MKKTSTEYALPHQGTVQVVDQAQARWDKPYVERVRVLLWPLLERQSVALGAPQAWKGHGDIGRWTQLLSWQEKALRPATVCLVKPDLEAAQLKQVEWHQDGLQSPKSQVTQLPLLLEVKAVCWLVKQKQALTPLSQFRDRLYR